MIDKINELLRRVEEFKPKAAAEIEAFRIQVLGKKGELNALMEEFKSVAPELKREVGQQLNRLKTEATQRINALREGAAGLFRTDGRIVGRPDAPGFGRGAGLAPSHFAREEPDRRDLLAPGLHGGRGPRDRG